jgi:hypothetical protein
MKLTDGKTEIEEISARPWQGSSFVRPDDRLKILLTGVRAGVIRKDIDLEVTRAIR